MLSNIYLILVLGLPFGRVWLSIIFSLKLPYSLAFMTSFQNLLLLHPLPDPLISALETLVLSLSQHNCLKVSSYHISEHLLGGPLSWILLQSRFYKVTHICVWIINMH